MKAWLLLCSGQMMQPLPACPMLSWRNAGLGILLILGVVAVMVLIAVVSADRDGRE
jgi:hypothetical protein